MKKDRRGNDDGNDGDFSWTPTQSSTTVRRIKMVIVARRSTPPAAAIFHTSLEKLYSTYNCTSLLASASSNSASSTCV